jgi:hypothetical protein
MAAPCAVLFRSRREPPLHHPRHHRPDHPRADPPPRHRLPSPRRPQAAAKTKLGVQGVSYVLRHHICAPRGNRTPNPLIKRASEGLTRCIPCWLHQPSCSGRQWRPRHYERILSGSRLGLLQPDKAERSQRLSVAPGFCDVLRTSVVYIVVIRAKPLPSASTRGKQTTKTVKRDELVRPGG